MTRQSDQISNTSILNQTVVFREIGFEEITHTHTHTHTHGLTEWMDGWTHIQTHPIVKLLQAFGGLKQNNNKKNIYIYII